LLNLFKFLILDPSCSQITINLNKFIQHSVGQYC